MKCFTIKKLDDVYELENFDYNIQGFHYPIKKNKSGSLKIKELIIVSPDITTNLICYNFNKKYQKIVECLFNNSDFNEDSDNTGTNLMLALDEVARLRTIIINKYQRFLKKQEAEELLKRLKVLENELRVKIIDFKLIKEQERTNKEERGKSR